ncbi:formyltransferase family protein [Picosynechococcus sp. NKBG15041c]|uniref:formyltransferase family protein n=1 Tax=Picosynechococcus sp. NKBG15041c TaxID=1407650 RepID=UPI001F278AA5|nr:formyltransferase family protein [Picosynechococcus sp. NKBG15041c]
MLTTKLNQISKSLDNSKFHQLSYREKIKINTQNNLIYLHLVLMKILLLGPNRPYLINFLKSFGDQVHNQEEKISLSLGDVEQADFLISYGYRHIIKKDVLNYFKNKAINIHISFLPWNRGADPNLWSFLEDNPKGVTIHYLDEGIDTGDIIIQQRVFFDDNETLHSSYEKLSQVAFDLFKSNWKLIKENRIQATPQRGKGSYHRTQDKEKYQALLVDGWNTPVSQLTGKAL